MALPRLRSKFDKGGTLTLRLFFRVTLSLPSPLSLTLLGRFSRIAPSYLSLEYLNITDVKSSRLIRLIKSLCHNIVGLFSIFRFFSPNLRSASLSLPGAVNNIVDGICVQTLKYSLLVTEMHNTLVFLG